MSEEEKKAIEYFKDLDISFNTLLRIDLNGFRNAIQLVLNLIEKQQKEIEKYKNRYKEESELNIQALNTLKECVHKDKIKEKIEELENLKEQIITNECMLELSASVEILKELLGETND